MSISEILDKLVGSTSVWCETNHDNESLENLEIIEEPKRIKKLDENNTNVLTNIIENRKKINEIIDKLNSMEK